jgi:hypothetical protein
MLMALELPIVSAVIARLAEPEINLAAYGGLVFQLALIIEAPIIMLLAASTALCKDWDSYALVRRFMMVTSAALTVLHILIAFTPLYYLLIEGIIGAPQEIVEPARIGLMIMTPWTWSIAYRRFNQGVLIRFGHSRAVSVGTVIRLSSNWLILALGYFYGGFAGIVVGTSAVAVGVVCEAIYAGIAARPVIKGELRSAPAVDPPLTMRAFLAFYVPLALTSLLTLLANPIGSAALSRMPLALESLAVWPVVAGMVFLLRSQGLAFNEVVVALLDEPRSYPTLRKFTVFLAVGTTTALFLIAATPLSTFWLERVSALSPQLAQIAKIGVWISIPLPFLNVLQSWFQGTILHGRSTRAIPEAVVIYLITSGVILSAGVAWNEITGLYVSMAALGLSLLTQTTWLWFRSRSVRGRLKLRDTQPIPSEPVHST